MSLEKYRPSEALDSKADFKPRIDSEDATAMAVDFNAEQIKELTPGQKAEWERITKDLFKALTVIRTKKGLDIKQYVEENPFLKKVVDLYRGDLESQSLWVKDENGKNTLNSEHPLAVAWNDAKAILNGKKRIGDFGLANGIPELPADSILPDNDDDETSPPLSADIDKDKNYANEASVASAIKGMGEEAQKNFFGEGGSSESTTTVHPVASSKLRSPWWKRLAVGLGIVGGVAGATGAKAVAEAEEARSKKELSGSVGDIHTYIQDVSTRNPMGVSVKPEVAKSANLDFGDEEGSVVTVNRSPKSRGKKVYKPKRGGGFEISEDASVDDKSVDDKSHEGTHLESDPATFLSRIENLEKMPVDNLDQIKHALSEAYGLREDMATFRRKNKLNEGYQGQEDHPFYAFGKLIKRVSDEIKFLRDKFAEKGGYGLQDDSHTEDKF